MRICTLGSSGDRVSQLKIELLPVWFGTARMGSKPGVDFKKSEIISDFRSLFRLFCVYRIGIGRLHNFPAYFSSLR